VSKQIAAELKLPKAQIAYGTFRDRVVPAVSEKQDTVFMAQIVRPLAIEMEDQGAVKASGSPGVICCAHRGHFRPAIFCCQRARSMHHSTKRRFRRTISPRPHYVAHPPRVRRHAPLISGMDGSRLPVGMFGRRRGAAGAWRPSRGPITQARRPSFATWLLGDPAAARTARPQPLGSGGRICRALAGSASPSAAPPPALPVPESYFGWQHRTAEDVRTGARCEVPATPWTQIRPASERIGSEFG